MWLPVASDDLRALIRRACAEAEGFTFGSLEPHDYQQHADKILAVVEPLLARRDKRIEEYRASRKRWMEATYADRGDAVRAAAERDALRVELDELLDRLDDDTVGPDQTVAALLDHLAELLPEADPAEDMEHYLRQARVGHRRALRARDRRLAVEARLAEVRRFCELTADSCHVPSRRTAQDILRYLDTGSWKEPEEPVLGYDLPDGFRAGPGGEQ